MKPILHACLLACLPLAGCIMINSPSEIELDATGIKYRSEETNVRDANSNTVSNAASWDGGGTVRGTVPLSGTK